MNTTPQVTPQVTPQDIPWLFERDIFRIVVQTPEAQRIQATDQVTDQVTDQDINLNLEALKLLNVFTGEHTRAELMTKLSLSHRSTFSNLYMKPLLEQGLVEMTIPDKPNSRNQKYRLTSKGEATRTSLV